MAILLSIDIPSRVFCLISSNQTFHWFLEKRVKVLVLASTEFNRLFPSTSSASSINAFDGTVPIIPTKTPLFWSPTLDMNFRKGPRTAVPFKSQNYLIECGKFSKSTGLHHFVPSSKVGFVASLKRMGLLDTTVHPGQYVRSFSHGWKCM